MSISANLTAPPLKTFNGTGAAHPVSENQYQTMSKENVEKLLLAGGADKQVRYKYNGIETKEKFIEAAAEDGYEFTAEELDEVLREEDFDFESSGNPRTRQIWLR
ncbi:MAG: Nif11-like leader peptide family natural product precursor [Puniceicoccales bacterium]